MIDESIFAEAALPEGMSVLVVEPDEQMAVFYRYLLQSQRFIPVTTGTVTEAMAAIAANPERYAAVVVDIDNAEAPGWQFVQDLRQLGCSGKMPVLAVAELIGTRAVFSQMRELCDAIILKGDFEIPRFHEQLNGIIRRSKSPDSENPLFNATTRIM